LLIAVSAQHQKAQARETGAENPFFLACASGLYESIVQFAITSSGVGLREGLSISREPALAASEGRMPEAKLAESE
jgi:hypothetical protein